MATVRDMIRKKGSEVYAISPESTVYEALEAMAKHNTGALLVMRGETMVGILSERDCVRKVDLTGKKFQGNKSQRDHDRRSHYGQLQPAAGGVHVADAGEGHSPPACL